MAKDVAQLGIAPRIYYLHHRAVGRLDQFGPYLDQAHELGFDTVLVSPIFQSGADGDVFVTADHHRADASLGEGLAAIEAFRRLAEACAARRLALWSDLAIDRLSTQHPLVSAHPELFVTRSGGGLDPRRPAASDEAKVRLDDSAAAETLVAWAAEQMAAWSAAGVSGFRLLQPDAAATEVWRDLIARVKARAETVLFMAETQGVERAAALRLAGCGFDVLSSSLAWWDGRSRWFVEEYEALRAVAPLVAELETPFGPRLAERLESDADPEAAYGRLAKLAAATGAGLLMPMGFEAASRTRLRANQRDALAGPETSTELSAAVRAANALAGELAHFSGEMRVLTGAGAPVTALLRAGASDVRRAGAALLILINPDLVHPATPDAASLLSATGADFGLFTRVDGGGDPFGPLAPGEVRLALARRGRPILLEQAADDPVKAARRPRLVVESVTPHVEGGAFPVRRVVGETVVVEADIFADGHEQLAAELRWRPLDQKEWSAIRMEPLANDRWRASFPLERLGRYEFAVEGWLDVFGGWRRDFAKKLEAGVAAEVDVQEGRLLIEKVTGRRSVKARDKLREILARLSAAPEAERASVLLSTELFELMKEADDRPFCLKSACQIVDAERLSARFASWYELFPRSMTDDPSRHGAFDDVIARLPAVRAMGFDVLYFPPIHPIGKKHRKGRNNSLEAGPDDPGSPYAIGSEDGGHEAIHRELGTFDDFRRLQRAAAEQGLELALDFAVQCSPDHPWLKTHPGWFDWRPDGSIKYAENPPKKYQDIVNVDFYKPDAVPDLWVELRDIVLLWVKEGVKLFRVDNPHTKPLPFWEWMIGEVRALHPDVVFLAEAFTRPKVMYRLAKIGFSQSYTYFTWRHSKAEFTEYLTELTTEAPKEFYRPHFFVNTPDINPYFLQTSGRAGFLIRAALAATLSGLWGVYSGFELLEAEPVPGKEEYKDSEKYEIKPRDWTAPGNIIAEITRLNRIRKGHPALQSHLGVRFLPAYNDNVLFFQKASPAGDDVVLVAINLDPHSAQEADIELPFARFDLPYDGALQAEELTGETRLTWRGQRQRIRLTPERPYAIWSVQPERPAGSPQ